MNLLKKITLLSAILMLTVVSSFAKGFPLYNSGKVAQIYVATDEPTPLKIAAEHLQQDIEMVTGKVAEIVNDKSRLSGDVIILTTVQNNSYTDDKLLDGLYQSYMLRSVKSPIDGVKSALVMVGSDALGAAYGVYNISDQIGVSPLYWYCDITPEPKDQVIITQCDVDPHQPSVKYRGIFVNDEEAKILWSQNQTEGRAQGITPETYKRVFELMLRLGANTLWPSMMDEGAFFFEAKDENGVAINPKNATDYGVYVGSSHCENMCRNNNAEWYEWASHNDHLFADDDINHEFDYTVNPKAIESYWMERLVECKDFNIVYTMGIRAVHDSAFKCRKMANPTLENKVKMLQNVLNRQREMIAEVFGSEDAVPQIFVPYEETAELYNGETSNGTEKCKGLDVPEDIILVSTDDNYSYLRQLPTEAELQRKGGCGIYYHMAYQGNPSPYDWLTTIPYKNMQQELRKLYDVGAMAFWIVNVGDIKPSELGLKYFMDIATDADLHFTQDPREYLADAAVELFNMDNEEAERFSDLFTRFCQAANRQKPEFMTSYSSIDREKSWLPFIYYSTFDFNDEAERMIKEFRDMEIEAKDIYESLPESRRDAFWHLTYYPIRSTLLMAEKSYYFYKNVLYARQGRFASLNGYKNLSQRAMLDIDQDLHYYNKELNGGKWDGLMDPYATYNIYERVLDDANIPHHFIYEERFEPQSQDGLGAVCEGQVIGNESVSLYFSSLEDNIRFVDIFATGVNSQTWRVDSSEPWVKFSASSGDVSVEERIWLSIDWSMLPAGESSAEVTVSDKSGVVKSYPIVANNITDKIRSKSYVEGAGFVAIEAEHYTKKSTGKTGSEWIEVSDLGYCGSSMVAKSSGKCDTPTDGAVLEYQVYFTSAGTFDAMVYRVPTLNEGKDKSCDFAIGVNDDEPMIIDGIRRKEQTKERTLANGKSKSVNWRAISFAQMERIEFPITIESPGYHTIKLYQMDSGITIDRIVISTNEQSAAAQLRSLVGAPESYNNISSSYKPLREMVNVEFATEDTEVKPYPELTPMLYSKFLFTKQGCEPVWGFTPVCRRNVYDKNTNLYGWDKEDADNIKQMIIVGSRSLPFFRLSSNYADTPATFHATMHEGNYEIMLHAGTITSYYSGQKGREYDMTITVNGEVVAENVIVESDNPYIGRYDVKVGKDNELNIEFSGRWGVSVIEIYRR